MKNEEEIDEDLIAELEEQLEGTVVPEESSLKGDLPVVDTFNFVKNSGKEVASTRLLALNRYTPGRSLSVSALQSDEAIFREILARLEEADAPYGRNGQIIRPVAIPLPEDIAESEDISAKKIFAIW